MPPFRASTRHPSRNARIRQTTLASESSLRKLGIKPITSPALASSTDWKPGSLGYRAAQTYRPFGTAAEYAVVPVEQAVLLPTGVSAEQGACLGIPAITAHRAVHVAGQVEGRTVLVQGGAGAVGAWAVQLAHRAGARVIATCREAGDQEIAARAGANEVLLADETLARRLALG